MSFPSSSSSEGTDTIFIQSLALSADIGPDCWNRASRSQPVLVSVVLIVHPYYLDRASETDDVRDSVHYGHLSKAVAELVQEEEARFDDIYELAALVSAQAFQTAGDAAVEVRVTVEAPKAILLADGFALRMTTGPGVAPGCLSEDKREVKVFVKDLVLGVIIGVNSPERESKQRVIVNFEFLEDTSVSRDLSVDYPSVISEVCKDLEGSSYLTLEKFVMEAIRTACIFANDTVKAVTVKAQKPSAISFAHSSGVEITRPRRCFSDSMSGTY